MTYIVEGLTAFLVKTLLRPKVYYLEPPKHRRKLDSPSLLIINHTSHLDGPVKILGPRARLIVSPQFHLAPPTNGTNSDYINKQTEMLQQKMKDLMEELVKRI